MNILVTGGAGYIGSHTCIKLLEEGYDIVVADNLSNSHFEAINRVREITSKDFPFYETDLRDEEALFKLFEANKIDCVIHFAGLKAVGESVSKPLEYYDNNLNSTISLCRAMSKYGVKKIIFSSSATVYHKDNPQPFTETSITGCTSPYGWTKLMSEQIIRDIAATDDWSVALLRYFNPVGAHESGRIGEDPSGLPNNLMPYITQTAVGRLPKLSIFGNDYNTVDGTGVRDYIHVSDLAAAHAAAIKYCNENRGVEVFNLGTGSGISVLQLVKAFEQVIGRSIAYEFAPRRSGDIDLFYSSTEKAERLLHWKAQKTLEDMCADSWRWQSKNPMGYEASR